VHDGLGRCRIVRDYNWQSAIGNWQLTNVVRYVCDGYLPIQERDGNNAIRVTYTRGLDLSGTFGGAGGIGGLLARTDNSGSAYYHADVAGNITLLTDSSGHMLARYHYDPFGRVLGKWGPMADANVMQFSSIPRHASSGLSLYPFRAYDSGLQRWLNRDPIREAGGINLYGFVGNNPISRIDPLGLLDDGGYPQLTPDEVHDYVQGIRDISRGLGELWDKYVDPPPPPGFSIAAAPPMGPRGLQEMALGLRGIAGTYKVCLNNWKSYVGKTVDIGKRLGQHVARGKWRWQDVRAIFAEEANTEGLRRVREAQRLMEETGGLHPSQSPNVLNERMPPKP